MQLFLPLISVVLGELKYRYPTLKWVTITCELPEHRKQGRDENKQEDNPTMERWQKETQEDYPKPAAYIADIG